MIKMKREYPRGYLKNGYYKDSAKRILKSEYVVEYSRHLADAIREDKPGVKSCELLHINRCVKRLKESDGQTEIKLAELQKLLPYAKANTNRTFYKFVKRNLESIADERDIKAFCDHLEATVAYAYRI